MAKCKWCGCKGPVSAKGLCAVCKSEVIQDARDHIDVLKSLASESTPFLSDGEKDRILKSATKSYGEIDKYRNRGIPFKTDIDKLYNDVLTGIGLPPRETAAQVAKKGKNTAVGCIVIIVIMVSFFSFAFNSCFNYDDTPRPPDDTRVKVESQYMIKDYLTSPSSAKFPLFPDEAKVVKVSDYEYKVWSYVDSQNGFGAMVRSKYYIRMTCNEDWTRYTAEDVIIEGNKLK